MNHKIFAELRDIKYALWVIAGAQIKKNELPDSSLGEQVKNIKVGIDEICQVLREREEKEC